jgi:hypothetical protein
MSQPLVYYKITMNHYIEITKTYVVEHKKEVISIAASLVVIAFLVSVLVYNSTPHLPKVVYQPTTACNVFTESEAESLLGSTKLINGGSTDPEQTGDTANTECSYSDSNPDQNSMIVAAVIVRSGINDKGVQENKTEFVAGRPTQNVEIIKGFGQNAYFNETLGQLNILDGKNWIVLSFGVGANPSANTLADAEKMAHVILNN